MRDLFIPLAKRLKKLTKREAFCFLMLKKEKCAEPSQSEMQKCRESKALF